MQSIAQIPATPGLPASIITPLSARHVSNRANAQRSSGPKSAEGKARVSQNAVTHGLYARTSTASAAGSTTSSQAAERAKLLLSYKAYFRAEPGPEEDLVGNFVDLTLRMRKVCADRDAFEERLSADPGMDPVTIEKASEILSRKESRLQMQRSRVLRDLALLAKLRDIRVKRSVSKQTLQPAQNAKAQSDGHPHAVEPNDVSSPSSIHAGHAAAEAVPELRRNEGGLGNSPSTILNPYNELPQTEENKANAA